MSEAGWAALFGIVFFGGLFATLIVSEIEGGKTERERLKQQRNGCGCGDDE